MNGLKKGRLAASVRTDEKIDARIGLDGDIRERTNVTYANTGNTHVAASTVDRRYLVSAVPAGAGTNPFSSRRGKLHGAGPDRDLQAHRHHDIPAGAIIFLGGQETAAARITQVERHRF